MDTNFINDEWPFLTKFLPKNWTERAGELGAFTRKRGIDSPDTLLRALFIHLAAGKSLRTTAAYAKEIGLCSVNDVALLNRFRKSSEWLRWMATELLGDIRAKHLPEQLSQKFRIKLVDGTVINEPGSTGTDWRLHFSINLKSLRCEDFLITSPKEAEGFHRHSVESGDLLIGDRGYCKRKGFVYVLGKGGNVMVRFHSTNLPLFDRAGKAFNVLERLKLLREGEIGDWDVWFRDPYENDRIHKGRLCSIKKNQGAIEVSLRKLKRKAQKRGDKLRPETIEYAKYVTLFTTVNRHKLKSKEVMELYRGRWQIELVFKRMKSIIKIGHLPKKDEFSCIAWLHGKLLLALLTERIHQEAEFISPWGYPLWDAKKE